MNEELEQLINDKIERTKKEIEIAEAEQMEERTHHDDPVICKGLEMIISPVTYRQHDMKIPVYLSELRIDAIPDACLPSIRKRPNFWWRFWQWALLGFRWQNWQPESPQPFWHAGSDTHTTHEASYRRKKELL